MFNTTHKVVLRSDYVREDGTRAVQLQIITDRKRKVIPLGFHVAPENFDSRGQRIVGLKDKKLEKTYNDAIFKANARLFDIINTLHFTDKVFTVQTIAEMYSNKSIRTSVQSVLAGLIEQESQRYPTSKKDYAQMLVKLNEYCSSATFGDIDTVFVRKWDLHMLSNGLQESTRGKHHKNFKKFLALVRETGAKIIDPYLNFKVQRPRGSRMALLNSELDKLIELFATNELPHNEQEALRCFLWSCGTGMRYQDVVNLTHGQFIGDKMEFVPQKTRKLKLKVVFPIGPNLMALVNTKTGRVFQVTQNATLNKSLKSVRKKAGIKTPMSFHIGRHTFATLFLENGGSPEVCMELMGISKWETIKIYIHLAESRKRKANLLYDARFLAINKQQVPNVV